MRIGKKLRKVIRSIELLVIMALISSCGSNPNYELRLYFNKEVIETILRNRFTVYSGADSNKLLLRNTYFFKNCNCKKKGKEFSINFQKEIQDGLSKELFILIKKEKIEELIIRHIINGQRAKARGFTADKALISLDKSNGDTIKGSLLVSYKLKEDENTIEEIFKGEFICKYAE